MKKKISEECEENEYNKEIKESLMWNDEDIFECEEEESADVEWDEYDMRWEINRCRLPPKGNRLRRPKYGLVMKWSKSE